MRTLSLLALILVASPGCASPPTGAPESQLSWVWILTGPRDGEVTGEARTAAFAGHFANMERMSDSGELLVAGPFGEPRVRDDHRGVFVLGTSDLAEARTIANTDPTARAGVFVFEVEPFSTADALERLMPMHTAAIAAQGVGEPPPGFHCRSYVLVSGVPADAAERALADAPVLFAGRIGAGENERALACLDATTAEQARQQLGDGDVSWTVMPWFASNEVTNLRAD